MRKSNSTSTSSRSGGGGGGLLSKTGSLFGTRSAGSKTPVQSSNTPSRPSTSSGDSATRFLKQQQQEQLQREQTPQQPSALSTASSSFSSLLASTTAPLGLSRTTSSRSVKDINGRTPSTRGHKAKSSAGAAVLTKTRSADAVRSTSNTTSNTTTTTTSNATSAASSTTTSLRHRPSLSTSSTRRKLSISRQKSSDGFAQFLGKATQANAQPLPPTEYITTATQALPSLNRNAPMYAPQTQFGGATFGFNPSKTPEPGKPPSTSHSNSGFNPMTGGVGPGVPVAVPTTGLASPHVVYQHIHEMASKRILTLDYLRKAHEGRVYWFNTLLFAKQDLAKISYFDPKKLSRRATNYLLLGLSIPTILDLNSQNPLDYLRSLNSLLMEFESFQQVHPPDGSISASFSRARLPAMFKRATHTTSKGRRTSSATEIGLPMNSSDSSEIKNMAGGMISASAPSTSSSFPSSDQELLPGEEYQHLLTPSLPFDPDFYETFATLCDVLIDCYTRVMTLISSPAMCTPGIGEVFAKADARVRKVIVGGVVKEFEDWSRQGSRAEIAGVGKVVLGGLV